MYDDPIVKEVRQARARLLKKHGGLTGLISYLKDHPVQPGQKVVSFAKPPRTPSRTGTSAGTRKRKAVA